MAAELQRLTGANDAAGYAAEQSSSSSGEEEESQELGPSESGSDADASSDSQSPLQNTNNADSETAALTASSAKPVNDDNGVDDDEHQPSPSGRHEDSRPASRSNARDLKATGVARAAARLLETDDPDGGLAILSKSKSVAKRQREEAAESNADKAAKKMRLEMKQRGHVAVPKRGEDPPHDANEKALLKTATRGVVRLFNAVSKAQRDQKDALVGGSRSRVAKLDKASFLAELRGAGGEKKTATALPAGTGPATAAPAKPAPSQAAASGWGVLSDSFGLQSGAKMKDWDKQDDSEEEPLNEGLQDMTDSDSADGA